MTVQRVRALLGAGLLGLTALVAACDDDDSPGSESTGGKPGNGGSPATGGRPLAPCLEQPDVLPRPPAGRLPCELLPPGFGH